MLCQEAESKFQKKGISHVVNVAKMQAKVQTEPDEGNMDAKGKPQIRTVL